jgi:hypothetical protein
MSKVLIVDFGAIGDVIMALPAARGLDDQHASRWSMQALQSEPPTSSDLDDAWER